MNQIQEKRVCWLFFVAVFVAACTQSPPSLTPTEPTAIKLSPIAVSNTVSPTVTITTIPITNTALPSLTPSDTSIPSFDFNGASILGISHLDNNRLMVSIDVPSGFEGEYRAEVSRLPFECSTLEEYPNRLYCIGPDFPPGITIKTIIEVFPLAELQPVYSEDLLILPTEDQPVSAGETWVSSKDGMHLVYVPEGEFTMGSNFVDELWIDDVRPPHAVFLDAFWIDQTEVTNSMYKVCADAGECEPIEVEQDNFPALVSWGQARDYCEWSGRRLATEAEWEKAARGTDARMYPWGNAEPTCENLFYPPANCEGDLITEVGSYPAGVSPYGVLDMVGNAWEWVADWYDWDYYSVSPYRNPQGPSSPVAEYVGRALRGVRFGNVPWSGTTWFRLDGHPEIQRFGFRCVR